MKTKTHKGNEQKKPASRENFQKSLMKAVRDRTAEYR
jgi:hypothetical protein